MAAFTFTDTLTYGSLHIYIDILTYGSPHIYIDILTYGSRHIYIDILTYGSPHIHSLLTPKSLLFGTVLYAPLQVSVPLPRPRHLSGESRSPHILPILQFTSPLPPLHNLHPHPHLIPRPITSRKLYDSSWKIFPSKVWRMAHVRGQFPSLGIITIRGGTVCITDRKMRVSTSDEKLKYHVIENCIIVIILYGEIPCNKEVYNIKYLMKWNIM